MVLMNDPCDSDIRAVGEFLGISQLVQEPRQHKRTLAQTRGVVPLEVSSEVDVVPEGLIEARRCLLRFS